MLCRSASLPRTALQVPLRVPAAVMCGSAKGSATATTVTWPETPLAKGQYAKELESACLAVQLASKLCRTVQQQLKSSETAGKQDDSPVTVADYGACCQQAVAMSPDNVVCQLMQCTSSDQGCNCERCPHCRCLHVNIPANTAVMGRRTQVARGWATPVGGSHPGGQGGGQEEISLSVWPPYCFTVSVTRRLTPVHTRGPFPLLSLASWH